MSTVNPFLEQVLRKFTMWASSIFGRTDDMACCSPDEKKVIYFICGRAAELAKEPFVKARLLRAAPHARAWNAFLVCAAIFVFYGAVISEPTGADFAVEDMRAFFHGLFDSPNWRMTADGACFPMDDEEVKKARRAEQLAEEALESEVRGRRRADIQAALALPEETSRLEQEKLRAKAELRRVVHLNTQRCPSDVVPFPFDYFQSLVIQLGADAEIISALRSLRQGDEED